MARFRKADRKGRSSGKPLPAIKKLLGPPKDQPWAHLSRELLSSAAWRGMSVNTRKFIDFLLIEHCSHAGRNNGNLKATYNQLQAYGLTRNVIRDTIREAESLGLVRQIGEPAMRVPNTYRLTFYSTIHGESLGGEYPTNDWKGITEFDVARIREEQRARRKGDARRRQKRTREKRNPGTDSRTRLVNNHEPDSGGSEVAESLNSADVTGTRTETPSISTATPPTSAPEKAAAIAVDQYDLFHDPDALS